MDATFGRHLLGDPLELAERFESHQHGWILSLTLEQLAVCDRQARTSTRNLLSISNASNLLPELSELGRTFCGNRLLARLVIVPGSARTSRAASSEEVRFSVACTLGQFQGPSVAALRDPRHKAPSRPRDSVSNSRLHIAD